MGGLIESRKRILKWFGGFLVGMLVLTLVSRGIYANGLPRVSVENPGQMAVEHVVENHVECGTDIRNKTSVIGADYAYTLNTFANCHTAAAQNTFAVVAEHMGSAVVNYRRRFFSVI